MKFENLKANLNKEILPAYFIGGDDSYLVYKALELIENACKIDLPDFNKSIFTKEGFNATDIVNACEVMPIGDSKRLVVVKDYLGVKNDKEKEVLVNYLRNPVPTTCLVLFASTTNNFYLSMVDKLEYVDCNKLSFDTLIKWIAANVRKSNFEMEVMACRKLVEYCSFNLTRVDSELNKLMAYRSDSKVITAKDVEEMVTKDEEYVIFELTDALASKDGDKAFSIVENLYYRKNTPTMILSFITSHFRRLLFSNISQYTNAELSKMLGVKEFAIIKAKEQGKKFSKLKLKQIYDLCLECDYSIKAGKMTGENAIGYLFGNILKD